MLLDTKIEGAHAMSAQTADRDDRPVMYDKIAISRKNKSLYIDD
jgi:hypothetical protein